MGFLVFLLGYLSLGHVLGFGEEDFVGSAFFFVWSFLNIMSRIFNYSPSRSGDGD